jgi:uncharacterized protein
MTLMNNSTLYEPLWQLEIPLTPLEQSVLHSFPLQRLHFISHMGAARFGTPMVHSRLQHTLGVFVLVAHYQPQHTLARLAALLHDIGHAPFSHALELLPDVNHHTMTEALLDEAPLNTLLENIDKNELIKLMNGKTQSVLKDKANAVNADNLDSWVRGGVALGFPSVSPTQLLKKFGLRNDFLETDIDTALMFANLIIKAAEGQLEPLDLAANALLAQLVGELIEAGLLDVKQLSHMIDAELISLLLHTAKTKERAHVLLFEPYRLRVRPLEKGETVADGEIPVQPYLYLAMPRVGGVSILEHRPELQTEIATCQALAGHYLTWIDTIETKIKRSSEWSFS